MNKEITKGGQVLLKTVSGKFLPMKKYNQIVKLKENLSNQNETSHDMEYLVGRFQALSFIFNSDYEIVTRGDSTIKLVGWKINENELHVEKNLLDLEIIDLSDNHIIHKPTSQIDICLNNMPNLKNGRNSVFINVHHQEKEEQKSVNFNELILLNGKLEGAKNFKISLPGQDKNYVFHMESPASTIPVNFKDFNKKTGRHMTVLGASSEDDNFKENQDGEKVSGWSFIVQTENEKEEYFSIKSPKPNVGKNQFNNVKTLTNVLGMVKWLNVKHYNSTIYVSPENFENSLTFKDKHGKFVSEIGLKSTNPKEFRYSTMNGLAKLIEKCDGLDYEIHSDKGIEVFSKDFLGNMVISASPGSKSTDILSSLGLEVQKNSSNIVVSPTYNFDEGQNVFSKQVKAQLEFNSNIINEKGGNANVKIAYVQLSKSHWMFEIYLEEPKENVILGHGSLYFDLNGEVFYEESSEVISEIDIPNFSQNVTINFVSDGCENFGQVISNDGIKASIFKHLEIDSDGFIYAVYENGHRKKTHAIPEVFFNYEEALVESVQEKIYSYNFASGLPVLSEMPVGELIIGELEYEIES